MQYKVKVVSEKEYNEWIAQQPLFFNDDMKKEMQQKVASSSEAATIDNNIALNN